MCLLSFCVVMCDCDVVVAFGCLISVRLFGVVVLFCALELLVCVLMCLLYFCVVLCARVLVVDFGCLISVRMYLLLFALYSFVFTRRGLIDCCGVACVLWFNVLVCVVCAMLACSYFV